MTEPSSQVCIVFTCICFVNFRDQFLIQCNIVPQSYMSYISQSMRMYLGFISQVIQQITFAFSIVNQILYFLIFGHMVTYHPVQARMVSLDHMFHFQENYLILYVQEGGWMGQQIFRGPSIVLPSNRGPGPGLEFFLLWTQGRSQNYFNFFL